jgi:hypothetical protein
MRNQIRPLQRYHYRGFTFLVYRSATIVFGHDNVSRPGGYYCIVKANGSHQMFTSPRAYRSPARAAAAAKKKIRRFPQSRRRPQ